MRAESLNQMFGQRKTTLGQKFQVCRLDSQISRLDSHSAGALGKEERFSNTPWLPYKLEGNRGEFWLLLIRVTPESLNNFE
jgi:hypothetical protein